MSFTRFICCVSLLSVWCFLSLPHDAAAQQSLQVKPAIYELPMQSGQVWRSRIAVTNPNAYPLTISATMVEYHPATRENSATFIEVASDSPVSATLAKWFAIPTSTITIPAAATKTLGFSLSVPDSATPGDHFAAMLIQVDSRPDAQQNRLKTTQSVASLFAVQVAGDVTETGEITAFSPQTSVLSDPDGDFSLVFTNTGTVHLQPTGSVTLYNMWGQERGSVSLDDNTAFGRVLPGESATQTINWSAESSFLNMGRYTAVAAVEYGRQQQAQVVAKTAIWILPVTQILIVGGALALLLLVVYGAARWYIRLVLTEAGIDPDELATDSETSDVKDVRIFQPTQEAPLASITDRLLHWLQALWSVTQAHPHLSLLAVVTGLSILFTSWFFMVDMTPSRTDSVRTNVSAASSSEQALFEDLATQLSTSDAERFSSSTIHVVNVSDRTGAAATLSLRLRSFGFSVTDLSRDTSRSADRTVIVYDPAAQDVATALSEVLDGALLSALPPEQQIGASEVTIYVGNEHVGW